MRGVDHSHARSAGGDDRQVSFQRLVLDLSARLLAAGAVDVDEHFLHVLGAIGEFVQADRAYVFLMREGAVLADNTHEWCSARATPQAHRLQGLDIDVQLPWFAAKMRRLEVMHVARVADLPEQASSERAEFEAEGIRSIVVVPMARGAELVGFLGFDAVVAERDWSDEAVAVLEVVGRMLTSVLDRAKARRDKQALDAHLREAQRLESLGLLAGGIAHDFNNLLTAVLGQSSLARLELPPDHPVQSSLRLISEAAHRAAELTHQLLAYTGRATFVRGVVDLSQLTGEMGPLLEASTSTRGLITWKLGSDPLPVMGDPSQFRQVLMNLVVNACDAVSGRGDASVVVSTGTTKLATRELTQSHFDEALEGRPVAWLEVRDNGPGIDPGVAPRIFDPFFSTKSHSRGLGLSAVAGIVRGHRGGLQLRTSPGAGVVFRILLPLATGALPEARPATPQPAHASGEGCVLVIDDDPLVRTAATMILRARGYDVLEASDGQSGLRTYGEHREQIDLVLLDMTMPGLNGAQVAERLRATNPDVRILVASGYPEAETAERMAANPPAGYLEKPFSAESLLVAVARLVCSGERGAR